jgi:hypothetical protein
MRANGRQQTTFERCGEQLCTFEWQVPTRQGRAQLLKCVHEKQSCVENVALPACLAVLLTPTYLDDVLAGLSRSTLLAFHTAGVVP